MKKNLLLIALIVLWTNAFSGKLTFESGVQYNAFVSINPFGNSDRVLLQNIPGYRIDLPSSYTSFLMPVSYELLRSVTRIPVYHPLEFSAALETGKKGYLFRNPKHSLEYFGGLNCNLYTYIPQSVSIVAESDRNRMCGVYTGIRFKLKYGMIGLRAGYERALKIGFGQIDAATFMLSYRFR